jgi:hypothetical protein
VIRVFPAVGGDLPTIPTTGRFGKWWATDIVDGGGSVELGFFNRTIYRPDAKQV